MSGSTIWLDWNQDLIVTPSGSVQMATGWDQVRQRIIRRIITAPAELQADGSYSVAGDVFSPDYGVGLGKLVDKGVSQDFLAEIERKIAQGVLEDVDVDTTIPPSIVFNRPNPSTLWIVIGVTLLTGQSGTISIKSGTLVQNAPLPIGSLDFSLPGNSQYLPGLM